MATENKNLKILAESFLHSYKSIGEVMALIIEDYERILNEKNQLLLDWIEDENTIAQLKAEISQLKKTTEDGGSAPTGNYSECGLKDGNQTIN